jgi:hypothetical protein
MEIIYILIYLNISINYLKLIRITRKFIFNLRRVIENILNLDFINNLVLKLKN